jgi:hypothetical protein
VSNQLTIKGGFMALDVTAKIAAVKEAMTDFDVQIKRYTEEDVNSAGSRARKALMIIKKTANAVRKDILVDQKEKKAARKAAKVTAPVADAPKKSGKKGKAAKEETAE